MIYLITDNKLVKQVQHLMYPIMIVFAGRSWCVTLRMVIKLHCKCKLGCNLPKLNKLRLQSKGVDKPQCLLWKSGDLCNLSMGLLRWDLLNFQLMASSWSLNSSSVADCISSSSLKLRMSCAIDCFILILLCLCLHTSALWIAKFHSPMMFSNYSSSFSRFIRLVKNLLAVSTWSLHIELTPNSAW